MKWTTRSETYQDTHTVDGITVPITREREVKVPVLPRDWNVISTRAAVGLVMVLTVVSVVWSTWSIGELLGGGVGYAAAVVFDLAWAVCLILEWKARFDPAKRGFPRKLGWALLVATMGAIFGHGASLGMWGMAIVGAAVSLFAKTLWLGVMKFIDRELSPADQQWVTAQMSAANAKMAVAQVRREAARIEHLAAVEMLAMEAQYGPARALASSDTTDAPQAAVASAPQDDALPVASAPPAALPAAVTPDVIAAVLAAIGQAPAASGASAPQGAEDATDGEDYQDEDGELLPPLEPPTLATLGKADAIRIALRKRPEYSNAQIAELLAGHGVETTPDYVRQVKNRDAQNITEDTDAEVVLLRKDA